MSGLGSECMKSTGIDLAFDTVTNVQDSRNPLEANFIEQPYVDSRIIIPQSLYW